jgi:hypothetical protein
LPTGLADILEVTRIHGAGTAGDELDVIVEVGAIGGDRPLRRRVQLAARTRLDGLGDNLLQRRVGDEYVR